ncbi:MAG: D-Ala-D-Ala carboxypeptidase family metallohydrolase [Methyloceanibacter sp.]|uniref:D-Ala-D-Ala carboxypeptidase family metallohydrolase n=1 Tax=Methyloceanibacter sp. TaxID=1965321 RepID=UPI003D9ACFA2
MRIVFALFMFLAAVGAAAAPASARSAQRPSTSQAFIPQDLKRTIAEIERRFGAVQVVSTHRPGAKIAGSGNRSKHADCRAVDFNPPRGKYGQVASWLKANHKGGVGTYSCGMNHIHIDNGQSTRGKKTATLANDLAWSL